MTLQNQAKPDSPSQGPQAILEHLLKQMKAQPGKTAATSLLVCVLLVLLLRGALRPKAASADVPNLLPAQATTLQETQAVPVKTFLQVSIPTIPPIQIPLAAGLPLPRDVFAVDLRRFPKNGDKLTQVDAMVQEAEPAKTAEARLEQLKRQVAAFRLQGTVTGPASVAFIGGTSVHEGEEYRGFRVTRILNQGIELERDGVRLELRMPEY